MSLNSGALNSHSLNAPSGIAAPLPKRNARFHQGYVVASLPQRNARLHQGYDVVPLPQRNARLHHGYDVLKIIDEEFILPYRFIVDLGFFIPWRLFVGQALEMPYQFTVSGSNVIPYIITASFGEDFGIVYDMKGDVITEDFDITAGLVVQNDFQIPYGLRGTIQTPFEVVYGLLADITAPFTVSYDMVDKPSVELKVLYSLLDETAINITGAITITIKGTGEEIEILDGSIEWNEGGYNWIGQITLAQPGDLTKFPFDEAVDFDIFGESYCMVVDTQDFGRAAPAQFAPRVALVGVAARLDTPRAQAITVDFQSPLTAQEAINQILGTTVTYETLDWIIPGGRLAGENASPIRLAQKVANAVGATIQADPDGTLVVRDIFPVAVTLWPGTTPAHVFTETADILSTTESLGTQEIFNKFRIRDSGEDRVNDRIEFEEDADDGNAGRVLVFPSPFGARTLRTTSDNIPITPVGEVLLEKTEKIEITDGTGDVGFPIDSITSFSWLDDDLGTPLFTVGEDEIRVSNPAGSTPEGYSVLEVVYQARALSFEVSSPIDDCVQFIVEEC